MKGKERWFGKCMDLGGRGRLPWSSLLVVLIVLIISGEGGVEGQTTTDILFRFYETPPSVTANSTATFRWGVVESNGSNPCATDQCVNQCKVRGHFSGMPSLSQFIGFGSLSLSPCLASIRLGPGG